jgi:predicted permease
MKSLAKTIESEHPETQRGWTASASSFRGDYAGEVTQLYAVMFGAVTCVLLIACANVAGLLLVRGAARQKEIAIRLALGASRKQIVRQLLAESVLLALAGGAFGSLLAVWGVDFAVRSIGTAVPFWIDFGVDYRALAFCAFISIGTGVVFGLIPALRASHPNLQVGLKEGGQAASSGLARSRLRSSLVVAELALAMILLAGAGILTKSFLRLTTTDRQYDTRNLVTAELEFLDRRYNERSQIANAVADLTKRFARISDVSTVALSHFEFLAGFGRQENRIRVDGLPALPDGVSPRFYAAVTPEYFSLLQLPLREGRLFEPGDGRRGPPVVIINARMARRLWPNEPAVGHRLRLGSADSLPWLTIIGVVGDVRDSVTARTGGDAFVPFGQSPGRPVSMLVRAAPALQNPLQLLPQLRAEAKLVDADLPLVKPMTVEQQRHATYWPYEMFALYIGGFAVLAVLMGAIGLYGVVAYSVSQRTREIGIRIALGADQIRVLRLVAAGGAKLALIGVGIGFLGAAAASQVLRAMIFGANPIDPLVYAMGGTLLTFVALIASYVPARRAASVSPLVALRAE